MPNNMCYAPSVITPVYDQGRISYVARYNRPHTDTLAAMHHVPFPVARTGRAVVVHRPAVNRNAPVTSAHGFDSLRKVSEETHDDDVDRCTLPSPDDGEWNDHMNNMHFFGLRTKERAPSPLQERFDVCDIPDLP